jgi:hypothetical protein
MEATFKGDQDSVRVVEPMMMMMMMMLRIPYMKKRRYSFQCYFGVLKNLLLLLFHNNHV